MSLPFLLAACAPTGSQGNTSVGDHNKGEIYRMIHDNVTTKSDARRTLGDPSDIDFDHQGHEKWTYTHIDRSSLWRNYLPLVNFFSRGTKDVSKKVVLIFNTNGVLINSAVSESCGETKYGIID